MKIFFCILVLIPFVNNSIAQTFRIPVGKDSVVHSEPSYTLEQTYQCHLNFKYDTCTLLFEGYYRKEQYPKLAATPFKNDNYPFPPRLHFFSSVAGIFRDSFEVYWTIGTSGKVCSACYPDDARYSFNATVIAFDSSSAINHNYSLIFDNTITIFPNPASGLIHIILDFVTHPPIHLHIFDELGNDVLAVFDGMMIESHREFSFKLPPGMYYARMETSEKVVTKKIFVE